MPNGIEGEAVVSDSEVAELKAMGVQVLPKARASSGVPGRAAASPPRARPTVMSHEATVRVVRADWFTTKGQGFLYVEARTTEGAQADPIVDDAARERQRQGHRRSASPAR